MTRSQVPGRTAAPPRPSANGAGSIRDAVAIGAGATGERPAAPPMRTERVEQVADRSSDEVDHPRQEDGRRPGKPGHDDRFDADLVHRVSPFFKLLRLYSRLEVQGIERIPEGGALLVANHTGWIGLDYAYAALSVHDALKRPVRGMAHHTWFMRPKIADLAARLGLYEVDKENMRRLVQAGELVLIFPEGERGAFKPERERYILQEFARGYVRVALETGVPIVPVAIVGGEEANPSTGRIDSYEDLLDLSLPMPQNLFPRPVKWRISFLSPEHLDEGAERAADREYVMDRNDHIRSRIQNEIARLISGRGHPFL